MISPHSANAPAPEARAFTWFVIVLSLALGWILWPFSGAIVWGTVLAIVFAPLYRRLCRSLPQRRTLAALATLLIILLSVILPLTLVAASLLQEGAAMYARMQSGEWDIGRYAHQIGAVLPARLTNYLDRVGLTDLDALSAKLSAGLTQNMEYFAGQALNIGQNAADFTIGLFVMLYLLFYLLRDGDDLSKRIEDSIPLQPDQRRYLSQQFTTVIRATVKGNLVVALAQGALGGLIFAVLGIHAPVLWAVVMAFLSLLPAVGAAIVWVPVAVYLLVTGEVWQGLVLLAFGTLVISTIDNVLRPILVGRHSKLPDYLVLISTLGGIAVFGINGFIIGPTIAAMFVASWGIFSAMRSGEPQAVVTSAR